ncbi:unnamed protein product [Sphagnum jensenii]
MSDKPSHVDSMISRFNTNPDQNVTLKSMDSKKDNPVSPQPGVANAKSASFTTTLGNPNTFDNPNTLDNPNNWATIMENFDRLSNKSSEDMRDVDLAEYRREETSSDFDGQPVYEQSGSFRREATSSDFDGQSGGPNNQSEQTLDFKNNLDQNEFDRNQGVLNQHQGIQGRTLGKEKLPNNRSTTTTNHFNRQPKTNFQRQGQQLPNQQQYYNNQQPYNNRQQPPYNNQQQPLQQRQGQQPPYNNQQPPNQQQPLQQRQGQQPPYNSPTGQSKPKLNL